MFYQKYAPKTLDEMILPPPFRSFIESCFQKNEFKHMLFTGVQGSGKSTLAEIIINNVDCVSKWVNSSADTGKDFITGELTRFVRSKQSKPKFVVMDEVGSTSGGRGGISKEAMDALKGVIDDATASGNTYFILTTNSLDSISKPVISRCQKFDFKAFPERELIKFCRNILEQEQIGYDRNTLTKIIRGTYPDIRATLNMLEFCSSSGKLIIQNEADFMLDKVLLLDYMNEGELGKIRELMVGRIEFVDVYRWLMFDFIKTHQEKAGELAVCVGTWAFQDQKCVDRLINMLGCFADCMVILNKEVKF